MLLQGDAIRIKLPHFNWQNSGDLKNQYLWIENRQLIKEYDVQQHVGLSCVDEWVPGIYSYIQVGKDIHSSDDLTEMITQTHSEPNGLGSWLFSLSAEGNYDYKYRTDLQAEGVETNFCAGGSHIPKESDSPETLPNPFLGASDLYKTKLDNNNDGILGDDDQFDIGGAEMKNNVVEFNLSESGDSEDAFRLGGNSKIGIGRNPSSMPLYTRRSVSNPQINIIPTIESYDNRTIWLNGVSVEIIEEIWNNELQAFDLKVKVRWDDFEVDRDTRWCGNIVLQPDINATFQSKLIVGDSRKITLDQSKSPTDYQGIVQPDGSLLFAEPTMLTISNGTKLEMKESSNITIKSQSTMVIENEAEIELLNDACIVVDEGGVLELRGNNITLKGDDARIVIKTGGTLRTIDGLDFTFNGSGYIIFEKGNTIDLGQGSNFVIDRDISSVGHRFIKILEDATLNIDGDHILDLTTGKIEYEENATILLSNNAEAELFSVHFDYVGASPIGGESIIAVQGNNMGRFDARFCDSKGLGTTFDLVGNTISSCVLETSNFINGDIGLIAKDFSFLATRRNDFINMYDAAIKLDNIPNANVEETSIEQGEPSIVGIQLNQVNLFKISRSYISDCITGISSNASNVFLRYGTTIYDNDIGIDFGDFTNGNFALTVGDMGCANIIDNKLGVTGDNIILNIDAVEHANNGGNQNPKANRFDNNGTLFDICYTTPSIVNDNPTILMKGNYWGGSGFLSTNSSLSINISMPSCHFGVNFDDSQFVSGIPNNCDFIMVTNPHTPTDEKVKCEIQNKNGNVMVHEQNRLAFIDLAEEKYLDAKSKYQPIADLTSDAVGGEAACLHKMYFARCMTNAINNEFQTLIAILDNTNWDVKSISDYGRSYKDLKIYPNPVDDFVNINTNTNAEFEITVYNSVGKIMSSNVFYRNIELNTNKLKDGIYFIKIINNKSKESIQKRIVVQ